MATADAPDSQRRTPTAQLSGDYRLNTHEEQKPADQRKRQRGKQLRLADDSMFDRRCVSAFFNRCPYPGLDSVPEL